MLEDQYRGKTVKELQEMNLADFAKLLPSRLRRTLKRGFTEQQKKLLLKLQKSRQGTYKKIVKTHARDMIILPDMINMKLHVYNGKEFILVVPTAEMLGHYLGEFSMTRKKPTHSAPGIGATKSSAAVKKK